MSFGKNINNVLVSVFNKEKLETILSLLKKNNSNIFSTGGTYDYIKDKGYRVTKVEDITDYPSILGGRVKTLHPKIFGGILSRSKNKLDTEELNKYKIFPFELIIVDLYPFYQTVQETSDEKKIIEKIDIGGVSLIRAAAKNYEDVLVISNKSQYEDLAKILSNTKLLNTIETRKEFASNAFKNTFLYDRTIYKYFSNNHFLIEQDIDTTFKTRYGENPHQNAVFFGNIDETFRKLNGKDISYNNLLDINSAVQLISEFEEPTFAILKHNNACGIASRENMIDSWKNALKSDPVSAFGGVLICNRTIDPETAKEINKIFFEVLIAPNFDDEALNILTEKKNRIILKQKKFKFDSIEHRSVLGCILSQEKDTQIDTIEKENIVTIKKPSEKEIDDLIFASKVCKNSKSNAIVLVKNKRLISSGVGQTSRVDALNHAVEKAKFFENDISGGVMASDAFFPFPDCVEIAKNAGVKSVIQPGGSIKDNLSIDYCNENNLSMVMSGIRHFKH